jgi:hypothetical protein
MGKQSVLCIYSRILLSLERQGNPVTGYGIVDELSEISQNKKTNTVIPFTHLVRG